MAFECNDCFRLYRTQSSLTRHKLNHKGSRRHYICSICNTTFARRDIYNRHIQSTHSTSSVVSRRRCHTACDACKIAKVKCDGRRPCQSCAANDRRCQYGSRRSRISTNLEAIATPDVAEGQTAEPYAEGEVVHASSSRHYEDTVDHLDMMDSTLLSPVSCDNHTATAGTARYLCGNGTTDFIDELTWPWLHESIFLQDNPFLPPDERPPTFGQSDITTTTAETAAMSESVPPTNAELTFLGPQSTASASTAPLVSVVDDLVAHGANIAFTSGAPLPAGPAWEVTVRRLGELFGDSVHQHSDSVAVLHHLALSYMENFNPLWPMFSKGAFDPADLHPVVLLTTSAIGAMYGSPLQRQYGSLMHERLRRLLAAALFDLEGPDTDLHWLLLSRLLTQVTALYFGQRQGFSYAQHIGGILVAQARRMNLFQEPKSRLSLYLERSGTTALGECAQWRGSETRRRVAFGIMRADVYTSVLLNTWPQITSEEMKLTIPREDQTWHNARNFSPSEQVIAQRIADETVSHLCFRDLIRIALDRQENLAELPPVGFELCLFGLQRSVWPFTHDVETVRDLGGEDLFTREPDLDSQYDVAMRMLNDGFPQPHRIGLDVFDLNTQPPAREHTTNASDRLATLDNGTMTDRIGQVRHQMDDMRSDLARVYHALSRWRASFDRARTSPQFANHRDTIMSCTLLYHLTILRLCTPLQDLHQVSYGTCERRTLDSGVTELVHEWSKSRLARTALHHADEICQIINAEIAMPPEKQARFNFLAYCSLHHAAVVLWTVTGTSTEGDAEPLKWALAKEAEAYCGSRAEALVQGCAKLFRYLSPLGHSSFGSAAERLAGFAFPRGSTTI